jgi:hypothetical protein
VLAILGFVMMIVFMYLIMSNRLSALIALIVVPVVFALISGFGKDLGEMMIQGVTDLAPTGIMLLFAILYFGIMIDSGLFDPLIAKIFIACQRRPVKNRRRHSGSDNDHFAGRRWDNNLYDYHRGDAAFIQTARHEPFGVSGNSDARFRGHEYYSLGRADCEGFGFLEIGHVRGLHAADSSYDRRHSLGDRR